MQKRRTISDGSNIVVVLIHGTFSPGAKWTRADSPLRRAIADQFGARVSFEIFNWSGRNSFTARSLACEQLVDKLRRLGRANPSKTIVVIAHSHGGNIAAVAASDPRLVGVNCRL